MMEREVSAEEWLDFVDELPEEPDYDERAEMDAAKQMAELGLELA